MIKSPCIKHCNLNTNGVCNGCFRTTQEISNWRTMSEKEKEEATLRAKDRFRAASLQVRNTSGENDK